MNKDYAGPPLGPQTGYRRAPPATHRSARKPRRPKGPTPNITGPRRPRPSRQTRPRSGAG